MAAAPSAAATMAAAATAMAAAATAMAAAAVERIRFGDGRRQLQ